jgi:hypothetical protein
MISRNFDAQVMDQALWRLHCAGGSTCVAENDGATYLVLFTSIERAEEFLRHRPSSWGPTATAALHSATQAEFLWEAGETAAQGLDGAVIDPQGDGRALAIIDFCQEETEGSASYSED